MSTAHSTCMWDVCVCVSSVCERACLFVGKGGAAGDTHRERPAEDGEREEREDEARQDGDEACHHLPIARTHARTNTEAQRHGSENAPPPPHPPHPLPLSYQLHPWATSNSAPPAPRLVREQDRRRRRRGREQPEGEGAPCPGREHLRPNGKKWRNGSRLTVVKS